MSLHTRFGRMVDAFRPAEGAPPATLMAFFRWCLSGAWPGLGFAAVTSALGGVADVVSALLLGMVVDAVTTSTPGLFWDQNWGLVALFAGFFLVIRPAIYGLSTASSNVIIGPNILPLVLSRLHRWTMGHAVTFFDNDFAGRIAQKEMQCSRAVMDVTVEGLKATAEEMGFDADKVITAMNSDAVTDVLRENAQLADALQIAGTPSFIIGDTLMRGMPQTGIAPVIEQARAKAKSDG